MKKSLSIRKSLNTSFLTLMTATISIICLILFFFWYTSSKNIMTDIQIETQHALENRIEESLKLPIEMGKIGVELLRSNVIDISNPENRNAFFISSLRSSPEFIYSYSYGLADGRLYGARRDGNGEISIMKSDSETGFRNLYYSVREDWKEGSLIQVNDTYDSRERPWYQAGKAAGKMIFTPAYKHFSQDDLSFSIAAPVYGDGQQLLGVLGVHLFLTKMNAYLEDIVSSRSGTAFILDMASGDIIANSLNKRNYSDAAGNYVKVELDDVATPFILTAFQQYKENGRSRFIDRSGFNSNYVSFVPYEQNGINWLIVISLPDKPLMHSISTAFIVAACLSLLAILLSKMVWNHRSHRLLIPILHLTQITESYTKGDYKARARFFRSDEIGKLVHAFNILAENLSQQVENLEENVRLRTRELEETNQEIAYLSYHDQLTGLYNRRYFEESMHRLDNPHNLPISMVMADMNGLKLINDAFGHPIGDSYLIQIADILSQGLRSGDIAARLGGDEFVILLPNTTFDQANQIVKRFIEMIQAAHMPLTPLSVSFGIGTKTMRVESLVEILTKADEKMYQYKLLENQSFRKIAIRQILHHLEMRSPLEKSHAERVRDICRSFAAAYGLNDMLQENLVQAAYLHDIGKVAVEPEILEKKDALTFDEFEIIKRHCEIGYRILGASDETKQLSEYILFHHENWDGSGYPKGIFGEEIPMISRILHIADCYVAMTSETPYNAAKTDEAARIELKRCRGTWFDPQLCDFILAHSEILSNPKQ